MKKLLFICLLISSSAMAQKMKLVKGDLKPLKDEKVLNVEFTYDNMTVGKKDQEADYVKRKTAEYNEKEAGRGDKWAVTWVSDRKERFEPKFIELFQKHAERAVNADAKYKLVFHTTRTEPGFNVGVMRVPAAIDAEVSVVEVASGNVIAVISVINSPGGGAAGFDFDAGFRIQESYAKAGKEVGQFIVKQSSK